MSTPTRADAFRIIELACRAPSVHNTQPWRWRVSEDATLELYSDRHRQLKVSDPVGRNLALSCGAALHHSIVAAQALGLTPDVELLPARDDEDLLARMTFTAGTRTAEALNSLHALEERCTDRRRFTSWPIPDSRLAHLAKRASGWGATVIPIIDVSGRFQTETLVKQAQADQVSDPRFIREQQAWTDHSRVDGMPLVNVSPPSHGRQQLRPNRFASVREAEAIEAADAARTVESTDGLVAICTSGDDQLAWLKAGQALSALWLQATHDGLSVVPLSQVIEVDETREALHQTVFDGLARPQILVRVGWSETTRPPLERTPRRPLDDVVEG